MCRSCTYEKYNKIIISFSFIVVFPTHWGKFWHFWCLIGITFSLLVFLPQKAHYCDLHDFASFEYLGYASHYVTIRHKASLRKIYVNKQPMGCEAQLACKCLFSPLLSAGDLKEQSRSGWPSFWCAIRVRQWVCSCKITSLCVQRLRLMAPWLSQNWFVHFDPCDPKK